jgi:pSer/pThr/pTyr-binding forkhead associated (FHA) protein
MALLLLVVRIILAFSLYAFLAWALWTMWQELQGQTAIQASRRAPLLQLLIEQPEGTHTQQFNKNEVLIGRESTCDCIIQHSTVSSRHALLSYHHLQWWLEDLDSTNGTFLNDEPVNSAVVLASGDQIRCGAIGIKVDITE